MRAILNSSLQKHFAFEPFNILLNLRMTHGNLQHSESMALAYKDSSHPKYLFIITLLGKHLQQTAEEHMQMRGASKHSIAFPLEGNSFILGEAWYKGTEAELGSVFAPVDLQSLFLKHLRAVAFFNRFRICEKWSGFNTN